MPLVAEPNFTFCPHQPRNQQSFLQEKSIRHAVHPQNLMRSCAISLRSWIEFGCNWTSYQWTSNFSNHMHAQASHSICLTEFSCEQLGWFLGSAGKRKNQDFIQLSVAFCYRNISYRISAFQIRLILHFHNHILSLTLCWHLTLVCDIINIMERASHVASINRVSMVVIGLPTFQIIPISHFLSNFDLGVRPLNSLTNRVIPVASLTQIWLQLDLNLSKETWITENTTWMEHKYTICIHFCTYYITHRYLLNRNFPLTGWGVLSPKSYMDVPAGPQKFDFLYNNFLPNFPPISIPFLKDKHPILTKLGAFYNNLPQIHLI